MEKITQIWGEKLEPYMHYAKVKIYYTKNGHDQRAVFMDYGEEDKPNYKLIESEHYARNRLSEEEQKYIGKLIGERSIIIKEQD